MNYETKRQHTQFQELTRAEGILEVTQMNSGGTFTRDGVSFNPAKGYAVAQLPQRWIEAETATPERVLRAIAGISYSAPYFGTWVDGGRIYIEPVDIVEEREAAIALGRERAQLAIYDFANKESQSLGPYGYTG